MKGTMYVYKCPCGVASESSHNYYGKIKASVGTCKRCGGKDLVLVKSKSRRVITFKSLSDKLNFLTCVYGIFVVIPTWFEPMKEYNHISISFMLVLMSIQVLLLRYSMRTDK